MLTLCDSVSVKILSKNQIIAGVGNELRVFEEGNNRGSILRWKLKNKIHGIDVAGSFILIYGEREFMVLKNDEEFSLSRKGKISDWISSGKIFPGNTIDICLITGHSVALKLKLSDSGGTTLQNKSSCEDKSTIYCSTIVGNTLQGTTVLAGSAFGELFAWKPLFTQQNSSQLTHQPILWRISGHNGVIFSIDVNIAHSLITTTSDDRSVRFYSISYNQSPDTTHSNFMKAKISPLRSVYGHNARVFRAKIVENNGIPFVISVGEDSHMCIWNENGDLVFKRRHHFGATIWDFDFNSTSKTLFSTSSDGNIISQVVEDYFSPVESLETKDNFTNGEYLAKISFIEENNILGVTNQNRLVYNKNGTWHAVNSFSGYKCTLLIVSGSLIALTGYRVVSLYKMNAKDEIVKLYEKSIVSNLIRSFCFLSANETLVCDEKGECKYSKDNFESSVEINLPKSKEPWITSALKHGSFLLLSTRQGNLLLYKYEEVCFNLISTIKHIHGHLGVTHMHLKKDQNDYFLVETAGHDATLKMLKVCKRSNEFSVVLTRFVPVTWVERIHKGFENRNYVIGFNDNHFLIWCFINDVMFQISCGGGHRCWDVNVDEVRNRAEFIFIKNRRLHRVAAKLNKNISNMYQVPYFSWHIKLCNTLETFPLTDREFLFVSGGEDNLLKFSMFSADKLDEMQLIENTSRHISSIKSIAIINRMNNLVIFSVGGRAQICVMKFDFETREVEELSEFMLKSTDMDRKYQRNTQEVDFDPETRFMSISVIDKSAQCDLYLGCSDGYIRKFVYKNNSINLAEALFYNRCILHMKNLQINSRSYLVSAATDGIICIWELESFNEFSLPILKIQHHESGVNSLDLQLKHDKTLLIVSGGDDQSIAYSEINVQNNVFAIISTKVLSIHTAQVNGVRISACGTLLYTVSVDQNISTINLKTMKLEKMISTCIADVKGLNILNIEKCTYSIIFGWGVQILEL